MLNDNDLIEKIRKIMPAKIAEELINIQPIDPNLFCEAYKNSKSEEELIKENYKPIDPNGFKLLWVNK
jgi:hypothetical protein